MDEIKIPKLVTPEIIETVLENEEALKALFHLPEEEGFIDNGDCKIAWNSKMIKFLLCDVQIYVKTKDSKEENIQDINTNNISQIYINVSALSNKKDTKDEDTKNYEEEIQQIKKALKKMNRKIEKLERKINDIEDFPYTDILF
ncbi:hypothetical protein [Thermohalobacter berrensis]|uniref:Uncharacterized protein n=1 Tax=Thermohalobacter berrensis TaxID=99594 RepID=A0A419SWC4_9FIRM|nr:hypothetical protein [Thermohalobacter berrensis]RKD29505.1 hypothetical protein BET03_05445 [Thermohalobacter berrensis]